MALFSLSSCLAVVPEEIRLWKPDTAPQATVMNSVGKRKLLPTLNPAKGVKLTAGLEKIIPIAAAPIIK